MLLVHVSVLISRNVSSLGKGVNPARHRCMGHPLMCSLYENATNSHKLKEFAREAIGQVDGS